MLALDEIDFLLAAAHLHATGLQDRQAEPEPLAAGLVRQKARARAAHSRGHVGRAPGRAGAPCPDSGDANQVGFVLDQRHAHPQRRCAQAAARSGGLCAVSRPASPQAP